MAQTNTTPDSCQLTDTEVLTKALNAKNGQKFELRFTSSYEEPALQRKYQTRRQAEMALLTNLAFWTGCNQEQMWRLFKRSELYRQDREYDREYRRHLLNEATELVDDVYDLNYEAGDNHQQESSC